MEEQLFDEAKEPLRKMKLLCENLKNMRNVFKPMDIKQISISLEKIRQESASHQQAHEDEYAKLVESVSALERELQAKEELFQKETMIVSQQEKIVYEKMKEMKARDNCKKQYIQRIANASGKLSSKDQQFLADLEQKLKAYKMFTGVMWDYPNCNDQKLSGYIRDESDRQLKMFHLDIYDKSGEEIVRELCEICGRKSGLK